jgi:microcystin-dependent protein
MSEPFIGQIVLFAGNFEPKGWAFCNGQLLSIAQNTALFAILGTTYGGNGQTTFALPDLRGRVPIHFGQGPGLSNYNLGQIGGTENVTLTTNQIPSHNHPATSTLSGTNAPATAAQPEGLQLAQGRQTAYGSGAPVTMNPTSVTTTVGAAGGNQPHPNLQPYTTLSYIIALVGIFPSRN